jgi:hypothetical protein
VIGITAARFGITAASDWDHGGQVWDLFDKFEGV